MNDLVTQTMLKTGMSAGEIFSHAMSDDYGVSEIREAFRAWLWDRDDLHAEVIDFCAVQLASANRQQELRLA